jgi:hypothetical protein
MLAIAQFLHVYTSTGATINRWQNFWVNATVDSHAFFAFDGGAIFSRITPSSDSLDITFPASNTSLSLIENGLALRYLATLDLYQFAPTADGTAPSIKTKIASYTGEFSSATVNDLTVTLQIGTNLDPTEAQVPPRKFTTSLVGQPPKV